MLRTRRFPTHRLWKALCLGALLGLGVSGGAQGAPGTPGAPGEGEIAADEVTAVLKTQSAAWNRGDLAAFTAVYAEDATFLSPTGITHGREAVLARYRKRYPGAEAMGTLSLEVIEVRPVPASVPPAGAGQALGASVAARWKLSYPGQADRKTAEGLTLLVLRRGRAGWEIVQDASM